MSKEWEDYSEHVLRSLARIERKLDEHTDTMQRHALDDEKKFDHIEKRLTKTETNVKWHARIGSAAGGIIMAVLSWSFHHGK